MRYLWLVLILTACGSRETKVDYHAIAMNDSISGEASAEAMILPYRDSLELTMNMVLVQNKEELTRGIPESKLGNLIADLLLERTVTEMPDSVSPLICLVNIGGLRIDLPQGDVSVRKVFELMPFENELDIIKLSPQKMQEMMAYLKEKGGQPISGMELKITSDGYKCSINGEPLNESQSYYVATSDYLADGGDSMDFFKEPEARIKTGIKIRDAIMDHFRIVGLSGNELESELDGRLIIE